jgi:hypothetical protein
VELTAARHALRMLDAESDLAQEARLKAQVQRMLTYADVCAADAGCGVGFGAGGAP